MGFAVVSIGPEAVQWNKFGGIVGSWVVTPAISGIIAYFMFISVQKLIFNTDNPWTTPSAMSLLHVPDVPGHLPGDHQEGLTHVGLHLSNGEGALLSVAISIAVAFAGWIYIRGQQYNPKMTARCTSPMWRRCSAS